MLPLVATSSDSADRGRSIIRMNLTGVSTVMGFGHAPTF